LKEFIERFQYNLHNSIILKSTNDEVTRAKIGNLFENFKTDIIRSFSSQLDVLQEKQKHEEAKKELSILLSKCR
jgi:hypothetical protein